MCLKNKADIKYKNQYVNNKFYLLKLIINPQFSKNMGVSLKYKHLHFDIRFYIDYSIGLSGTTIAQTIYAISPKNFAKVNTTQSSLTIVGSTLKYSAIPPQTPNIILFVLDL
jgi:hypothetical protein